jgi:hypothetical protein
MGTKDNAGIINLINRTFAKTFVEEAERNPITFLVGKYDSNPNESTSNDSVKESLAGAVVGKTLNAKDVYSIVTVRNNWIRGNSYNAYDPTRNNDNHYVLVTKSNGAQSVWLCIDNGASYNKGLPSTVMPIGNFGEIIKTDDGYRWLKLYNISGKLSKFLTNNFIPVPTNEDIANASTDSVLSQSQQSLDFWQQNRGSLLRVDVDPEVSRIRWSGPIGASFNQITSNQATINVKQTNDTTNSIIERRGYKLEDIEVQRGGTGYTEIYNNLSISTEPNYSPEGLSLDHLVGDSYSPSLQRYGPLIKPIFSLGSLDFAAILNADRGMFVASMDFNEIKSSGTETTTFDSVSLVQNLKHSGGQNIEKVIGKNTVFRASDIITLTTAPDEEVGDTVISATLSNNTKSILGKVTSVNSSNKKIELVGGDKNMNVNDIVFRRNSTVNTPSNIVTNSLAYASALQEASDSGFSLSLGPTTSAAAALSVGNSTETRKIESTSTAIDLGEGRLGKDTVALYTNKFLSSSAIQNTQGIVFRAIIGGDGIKAI